MNNSRLTAFEILCSVFRDNAYSNIALDKALKNVGKDKSFISNLVNGVVERKLTLDYILDKYLEGKTKIKVKIILYLGAYQLYFMDRVPASAAINESVELAKQVGVAYYKNLINAVLHRIDENRINIDDIEDFSIRFSCPQNLINMWNKAYGEESTLKILSAINSKPPVYAVPNPLYVEPEECLYELNNSGIEGEISNNVIRITSSFDLSECKPFADGLFHIEDLSSYNCAVSLGAKENEKIIDVCSAPGGKAFTIAEMMKNTGVVYACDLYEHRVKLIEQGGERLGLKNITASINDATVYNPQFENADRVLCDVPCSGFGIIRRKPEIRYKNLDSIKELPEIQFNILSVSSRYLKAGGRLVYSTCTLNKRENENVVQRFLESNESFEMIEEKTTFPSFDGGDGFYHAVLERKND